MEIKTLLQQKGGRVFTISGDASAREAFELLKENRIGCLVVLDGEGHLEGIISERDLLYRTEGNLSGYSVRGSMTPKDQLIVGYENDTLEYAMSVFTNARIRHMPIIKDNQVIGIISIGDVVKTLIDSEELENKALKRFITGAYLEVLHKV